MSVGEIAGLARPEFGPDVFDLACDTCGATWCGERGMACPWCAAAAQRQRVEQRRPLLFPAWLRDDHGPRYEQLDEVDKAVWDRTRGQVRGEGSVKAWVDRLVRAVESGLITEVEARAAALRVRRER